MFGAAKPLTILTYLKGSHKGKDKTRAVSGPLSFTQIKSCKVCAPRRLLHPHATSRHVPCRKLHTQRAPFPQGLPRLTWNPPGLPRWREIVCQTYAGKIASNRGKQNATFSKTGGFQATALSNWRQVPLWLPVGNTPKRAQLVSTCLPGFVPQKAWAAPNPCVPRRL